MSVTVIEGGVVKATTLKDFVENHPSCPVGVKRNYQRQLEAIQRKKREYANAFAAGNRKQQITLRRALTGEGCLSEVKESFYNHENAEFSNRIREANGRSVEGKTAELIREAASPSMQRSDLPEVVSAISNKFALDMMEENIYQDPLGMLFNVETFRNLTQKKFVSILPLEMLPEVREGATFPELYTEDLSVTADMAKYGAIFKRTYELGLQDDLGLLQEIPQMLLNSAERRKVVNRVAALDSIAVNASTQDPASAAIVKAAIVALKNQMDGAAKVTVEPQFLVCPEAYTDTKIIDVREMLKSPERRIAATGSTDASTTYYTGNVLMGTLVLIGSQYLTADYWFLSSANRPKTLIEAVLSSMQTPQIRLRPGEDAFGDFDSMTFGMRVAMFHGTQVLRTYANPAAADPRSTSIHRYQIT